EALVIFQGPHAYVSPAWYTTPLAVPTWNYAVVHAYGTPRILDERGAILPYLDRLVRSYEQQFEQPWELALLPPEFTDRMMSGIVAFEIPISRLEGKLKLSQNRSVADQQAVLDALAQR